ADRAAVDSWSNRMVGPYGRPTPWPSPCCRSGYGMSDATSEGGENVVMRQLAGSHLRVPIPRDMTILRLARTPDRGHDSSSAPKARSATTRPEPVQVLRLHGLSLSSDALGR